MEATQGYRLSDIVGTYRGRRELPSFDLVLDWFWQACRAVGEMHDAGRVHGAIQPGSIVIGHNDRVMIERPPAGLSDFSGGVASPYAAPEQREGCMVDHRADLYSLGATFYELLTLLPSSPSPRAASAVNVTVPPAFDAILDRMLAARPEDRCSSADEILTAVETMRRSRLENADVAVNAATEEGEEAAPVPRLAMIIAGAILGAAVGAAAGYFLGVLLPAVVVGAIVGAVIGIFTNPRV
jgi:serine/threonine-protein kinase